MTFLEFKIVTAGEGFIKIINDFKSQNQKVLNRFEHYLEKFDTEAFQNHIDDLINRISKFSAEQKQTFKKEVLPSLREMFESMRNKLEEKNNNSKSKELEKQLREIEKAVDV